MVESLTDFENIKVGDIILKSMTSWGVREVYPLVCTCVCGKSKYFNYANDLYNTDYYCNGFVIHNVQEFTFCSIATTNLTYFDHPDGEYVFGDKHIKIEDGTMYTWSDSYEDRKITIPFKNDAEICEKCGGLKKMGYECKNCMSFAIKPYDYKDYEIVLDKPSRTNKGEEDLFIGFELEFEMTNTKRNAKEKLALKIKELLPNFVLECKRDGSLNNGFEVLSQPIHINRINTPWYTNRIKSLFDLLKEEGCVAEDTCGLHFHLSNAGLGDIRRTQNNMLLLTDTLQDYIKRWSNRLTIPKATYRSDDEDYDEDCDDCCCGEYDYYDRDLFHYCKFINDNFWTDKQEQRASWYDRHDVSHYNGVNIENTSTTEFRFFASTLDEFEFMTDINLLMAITRISKKDTINRVSVEDIINKVSSVYRERLIGQVESLDIHKIIYDYDVEPIGEEQVEDVATKMGNAVLGLEKYILDNFRDDVFFRRWFMNVGLTGNIFNVLCEISKYKQNPNGNRKKAVKGAWKDMVGSTECVITYLKQPTTSIVLNTKNSKETEFNELISLLESVTNVK